MKNKKSLPEFLKAARENAGLTQAEVANLFGYGSAQFVSNWERGLSAPPVDSIRKLAKLYKVKAEDLFEVFRHSYLELTAKKLDEKFASIS